MIINATFNEVNHTLNAEFESEQSPNADFGNVVVVNVHTRMEDEWINIADITLEEMISYVGFDQDINGQPFSLKKVVAKVITPEVYTNDLYIANTIKNPYKGFYYGDNMNGSTTKEIMVVCSVVEGKFTEVEIFYNPNNTSDHSDNFFYGDLYHQPHSILTKRATSLITQFRMGTGLSGTVENTKGFPAGTVIKVWGLKA